MAQLLEADFELLDKLIGNVFVHKGAGGGDAGLAAIEKEVLGVVGECVLEVGVGEDERGGFAAEFEGYAFEVAASKTLARITGKVKGGQDTRGKTDLFAANSCTFLPANADPVKLILLMSM